MSKYFITRSFSIKVIDMNHYTHELLVHIDKIQPEQGMLEHGSL